MCHKILNASPSDGTAFHCKLVCLLQMGKFSDVLRQMDDNAKLVADRDVSFEKAYALYRWEEKKDVNATVVSFSLIF